MLLRMMQFVSVTILLAQCFEPSHAGEQLLLIHHGDLPIVISAPHGGGLAIPEVPARAGEGLQTGAAGFRTARDTGTEELALEVSKQLDARLAGSPTHVISRVHRKYVDFNRPPEIGVEDLKARMIYDLYHVALRDAVQQIRANHGCGLLIDIHGQGSSAKTVYRGTSNGLTVTGLKQRFSEAAHSGQNSLLGILRKQDWTVHPNPFDGKEQSGFTGGYIVRTYGSHRVDGIDAIQLEFGSDYRKPADRTRVASELADSIVSFGEQYLELKKLQTSTESR
jgi:N-formylglutamate amidohydrolase